MFHRHDFRNRRGAVAGKEVDPVAALQGLGVRELSEDHTGRCFMKGSMGLRNESRVWRAGILPAGGSGIGLGSVDFSEAVLDGTQR